MRRIFVLLVICMVVLLPATAPLAGARPDKEWKDWFGHLGIGWGLAQGTFGDLVNDTVVFDGGATYWPETWPVGLNLDAAYSNYDFSAETLRRINEEIDMVPGTDGDITGGDTNIWSINANLIWGPDTSGSVGFYLIGGVGLDFVEAKLTTVGTVVYPPICGWWWCVPGGIGPGTLIVGSQSSTEFGFNAGIGVTFEMDSGSQIYIEARYKSTQTDIDSIERVPLVVGWRW